MPTDELPADMLPRYRLGGSYTGQRTSSAVADKPLGVGKGVQSAVPVQCRTPYAIANVNVPVEPEGC